MAWPEGVYPIVEATLYLATAPKNNSAGAYFKAVTKVEEEGKVQVPQHLQVCVVRPNGTLRLVVFGTLFSHSERLEEALWPRRRNLLKRRFARSDA